MKRALFYSFLVLAVAGALYARSSGSTITVTPSEMKNGETKTFTDDGKTITIRRDNDAMTVKIEGAGETQTLLITKTGDGIIKIRRGTDGVQAFKLDAGDLVMPQLREVPRARAYSFFVCPKDHTTLNVPDAKEGDTFKCPVDGTTMEKRKGHGFFFDDHSFSFDM